MKRFDQVIGWVVVTIGFICAVKYSWVLAIIIPACYFAGGASYAIYCHYNPEDETLNP